MMQYAMKVVRKIPVVFVILIRNSVAYLRHIDSVLIKCLSSESAYKLIMLPKYIL